MVRKFGGERVEEFRRFGVEYVDFVAIGERDEEARIVAGQKQGCWVRATFQRHAWLAKRNESANAAILQVEFGDGGGVPERDEAALAVGSHDSGVRERSGNALESGEIEAVDDFAIGCVEEKGFVGTVGCDEETLDAVVEADAQASGIGDFVEFGATDFSARNAGARRERQEAFGSDCAVLESIDGDSVSRASLPFSQGIGEGAMEA